MLPIVLALRSRALERERRHGTCISKSAVCRAREREEGRARRRAAARDNKRQGCTRQRRGCSRRSRRGGSRAPLLSAPGCMTRCQCRFSLPDARESRVTQSNASQHGRKYLRAANVFIRRARCARLLAYVSENLLLSCTRICCCCCAPVHVIGRGRAIVSQSIPVAKVRFEPFKPVSMSP